MAKTYEYLPTRNPELDRVVDREGNWNHYRNNKTGRFYRAVSYINSTGMAKPDLMDWLRRTTPEEIERRLSVATPRGTRIHRGIESIFDLAFLDFEKPAEAKLIGTSTIKMNRQMLVADPKTNQSVALSNDEWDAMLSFSVFWIRHAPIIIRYEYSVKSEKHGYAGTPDIVCILTKVCGVRTCPCAEAVGKVVVLDWKSGSGIRNEYGPATAAYLFADEMAELKPVGTGIVRLGTEHKLTSGYEFKFYDKDAVKKHFLQFKAAIIISDSIYKPFNPDTDIQEIPDSFELTITNQLPAAPEKVAKKVITKNGDQISGVKLRSRSPQKGREGKVRKAGKSVGQTGEGAQSA